MGTKFDRYNELFPFDSQDAVWIMNSLYVKRPEALPDVFKRLKDLGYTIENQREDEDRKQKGISVETMEKDGWLLWYCKLPDIRFGKCGSCNQYISMRGIQSQDHRCEKCGAITYQEIMDGSLIRFSFKTDHYVMFGPQLLMKCYCWNTEGMDLYLYPEFLENSRSLRSMTEEEMEKYWNDNRDKWEEVVLDGKKLYRVQYKDSFYVNEESTIDVSEITYHYWNHKIVKLWDGKEYGEWDDLDIPESVCIYEAWHWSPLDRSPTLHEQIFHAAGQVADQGWYHQDGRPAFDPVVWKRMRTFVEHFTTLDIKEWDQAARRFRKDGPGAIADVARFCAGSSAQVTNKPNIGNALEVLGKSLDGQSVSQGEIIAAARYFQDEEKTEEEKEFYNEFFGRFWGKKRKNT